MTGATNPFAALEMNWLAALFDDAQAITLPNADEAAHGERHAKLGTFPMLTWIQQTSLWKRKLDSLRQLVDGSPVLRSGSYLPIAQAAAAMGLEVSDLLRQASDGQLGLYCRLIVKLELELTHFSGRVLV